MYRDEKKKDKTNIIITIIIRKHVITIILSKETLRDLSMFHNYVAINSFDYFENYQCAR